MQAGGEYLEDRGPSGLETLPRGTEVQTPDAQTLDTDELQRLVVVRVEPRDPVPQRLGVVGLEPFDVRVTKPVRSSACTIRESGSGTPSGNTNRSENGPSSLVSKSASFAIP